MAIVFSRVTLGPAVGYLYLLFTFEARKSAFRSMKRNVIWMLFVVANQLQQRWNGRCFDNTMMDSAPLVFCERRRIISWALAIKHLQGSWMTLRETRLTQLIIVEL